MDKIIYKDFQINYLKKFVELSGDNNPLHTDEIYSRRLLYGKPVIHGILSLLKILDLWLETKTNKIDIDSLKVKFIKPLFDGDVLNVQFIEKGNSVDILAYVNSGLSLKISLIYFLQKFQTNTTDYTNDNPSLEKAKELSIDDAVSYKLELDLFLNEEFLNKIFKNIHKESISLNFISVLLASTRAVGVYCPGSNSLYSELFIEKSEQKVENFRLAVDKTYKSLNLSKLKFQSSTYTGVIKAFFRNKPQEQIAFQSVLNKIENKIYQNEKVLIIGGSRGLGEVTAKILAAGGADVTITYALGKLEAEKVAKEIFELGGNCRIQHFDITKINFDTVNAKEFTSLFYFATPFIQTSTKDEIDADLLDRFNLFYVVQFFELVHKFKNTKLKRIFYPSTVFVEQPPANLKEYALAKAGGEFICSYLNSSGNFPKIHFPKLEKMKTDQTTELLDSNSKDSFPILLNEIIKFYNT